MITRTLKLFISFALLFSVCCLSAAPKVRVVKASPKAATSFAIFVDQKTYDACKDEIDAYRTVLESEGLGTYIISAQWETPEDIRQQIVKISRRKPALEGFVFMGDIPVVRVRQAQFMTTAFKMNENSFPFDDSSVTSDRFYDDLDLAFDFIQKDSVNHNHFYYNLSIEGSVKLEPDFYSARIMVPKSFQEGEDPYLPLKKYLQKVVAAHQESNATNCEGNILDNMIFFAGHAYNSDCLTVWRQQPVIFREYFPAAFEKASGNEFMNFRQDNYMKYPLFSKMQQEDTDIFLFYEHGATHTQYINGSYTAETSKENLRELKRSLRNSYRRYKGSEREAEFIGYVSENYHLDTSMFSTEELEKEWIADSTARADVNISLEDLSRLKTGSRVTILNACYNGSFNKDEYVAGYHLFNDGRTVVTQGNTVNVLQDKWAEELIGFLALGMRVGMWQKEIATLESHLVGDPTFRFTQGGSPVDSKTVDALAERLISGKKDPGFWQELLKDKEPTLRATAIKQLSKTRNPQLSELFYDIFTNDTSWIVRLQALKALASIKGVHLTEAVKRGIDDPYEMIRRQSCHMAGDIGDPVLISPLVKTSLFSNEVQRTVYAAQSALQVFDPEQVRKEYLRQLELSYLTGKENLKEIIEKNMDTSTGRIDKQMTTLGNKEASALERESAIRQLRNNHLHYRTNELLAVLSDNSQDPQVRQLLCEALGWYTLSIEREQIMHAIKECLANEKSMPANVEKEMKKTLKRLI